MVQIMETTKKVNSLYNAYYKAALTKGAFEYYMLYESQADKEPVEEAVLEKIHAVVSSIVSDAEEDKRQQLLILEQLRQEIVEKMQVLTTYTDCFQIYEYVLNRLEQKYEPRALLDETLFTEKLFQHIFSNKDTMIINETIRESIAQLPVRMTKQRYFDLLSQSIGLYKGSDKEALDAYLYMLQTSAMLYRPRGYEKYFTEYQEPLEELRTADYEKLSKSEYDSLTSLLGEVVASLLDKTDFYISVQELLNSLTAVLTVLASMDKEKWDREEVCQRILSETLYSFNGETVLNTLPDELTLLFSLLEGQQENAYEQIENLEGVTAESSGEISDTDLWKLEKLGKLMSTSIFASLEKESPRKLVDADMVKAEAERLTAELRELFQSSNKRVVRAVMATTLQKIPVFFEDTEDVRGYIVNSLEQCRDISEKNVSMGLLMEFMEIS